MLDLKALAVFVKVGERRSFIRAARELGITQSGVSNAISRLEEQLGLRLLARTTRSVGLTRTALRFSSAADASSPISMRPSRC